MRTLFAALLLTSLTLPSAFGQANSAPPPRPLPPSPTPAPSEKAEKSAHSRSLLQRIFGPRVTPTPVPAPTPAPVVKRRPKPKPAPAETAETPAKVTPKVTPKETAKVSTPATESSAPTTAGKPKTGKGTPKKGAAAPSNAAALDDATKFKNAKAKALEDAHIRELKGKADGEVDEAAAHKALVNYNRALFEKIREVDPSVSDYAGKVEQAMAKRIGAEKVKE